MVLVKHGSEGEKHRGEERGSEKQGTGGEQERRKRARSEYSTLHLPSPVVRAATSVRPPCRTAPFVLCAVRALGREHARAPPLPPCLRGGTGAGVLE